MRKSDLFFNVLRLPVDFVMLLSAGLVTYLFRTQLLSAFRPVLFQLNLPLIRYFYLVFFVALLFLGTFALSGLYSMKKRLSVGEEFSKIFIASSASILGVIIFIFLSQTLFDSRFLILGGWFFAIIFVFLGRMIVRQVQSISMVKYGFGAHRTIIVGSNGIADKINEEIKKDPLSGYVVVENLSELSLNNIDQIISSRNIDEIILADQNFPAENIGDLINLCQEKHIIFKFIPAVSQMFSGNYDMEIFKDFPLVEIKRTNLEGWGRVIKRVLDVFASLVGLVILSPLLGLAAFAIKWETEGPVFVRLRRISGIKEFELLKFRSMVNNAEELKVYLAAYNERKDGPLFKMRDDPRITKIGRIIRKFRLDELPQLWNVFRGDISLVGPRPHQPDEIARYKQHHKKVLAIKAGATGIAQSSGSSDISFEKEVALDTFYIDNWSLWLDLKIIAKTAVKMLSDRSAV